MAKQDEYIRFTTRIPPKIRDALYQLAKRTERSLNGEVVARLQIAIDLADPTLLSQTVAREERAQYILEDPEKELIDLVMKMPEEKQRALLLLLK